LGISRNSISINVSAPGVWQQISEVSTVAICKNLKSSQKSARHYIITTTNGYSADFSEVSTVAICKNLKSSQKSARHYIITATNGYSADFSEVSTVATYLLHKKL